MKKDKVKYTKPRTPSSEQPQLGSVTAGSGEPYILGPTTLQKTPPDTELNLIPQGPDTGTKPCP